MQETTSPSFPKSNYSNTGHTTLTVRKNACAKYRERSHLSSRIEGRQPTSSRLRGERTSTLIGGVPRRGDVLTGVDTVAYDGGIL